MVLGSMHILMIVEYKLCQLRQIWNEQAMKFVEELSLLLDFGTLPFG